MARIRQVFAWLGGLAFIVLSLLVMAAFVYRAAVTSRLSHQIFVTHSSSTDTPMTYGVGYREVKINSHGRMLVAWMVDAGPGTPAVLIFHGNSETISNWAPVQAYLLKQHVSSMAFDYSGFGKSTGMPSIAHLDEDAPVAWHAFVTWARDEHPKFVLGYSLGTAVALHNAPDFQPQPLGVAVYGAFDSSRNLMGYLRAIPSWLVPITPDVWDNVNAALALSAPLLVVAGEADTNVPPDMGRPIALNAGAVGGGRYVLVPDAGHRGIEDQHMDTVWAPILSFIHQRAGITPANRSSH